MSDEIEKDPGFGIEGYEEIKEELKEPDLYKVILFNDHYTTMDFVVEILQTVFHKSVAEAVKLMMEVHKKGKSIVGVFSYDIAKTKVIQVKHLAKEAECPLKCSLEQE